MDERRSNLDLLTTEIAVIWGPQRREPQAPPSVVVGDAGGGPGGGLVLQTRNDLDPTLVGQLRTIATDRPAAVVVGLTQGLLRDALGPMEVTVGPGYDCGRPVPQPDPVSGRLIRSDRPDPAVAGLRVPPTWDAPDWQHLVSGGYGPWAMVIDADRVLSLCHSARQSADGVEAGTWTADDARGRGLAAAATAAWADACSPLPGDVFYSTGADNISSQRVARRLGLPLIGQLWKFRMAEEGNGPEGARLSVAARSEPPG